MRPAGTFSQINAVNEARRAVQTAESRAKRMARRGSIEQRNEAEADVRRYKAELERIKNASSALRSARAQNALRINRRRARDAAEAEAGTEEVVGFVPVIGTGEILYETNFPTPLTGNLAVFGGGALTTPTNAPVQGPGDSSKRWLESLGITRGRFPTWSVGVARWKTRQINTTTVYFGAVFVFVVTGTPNQESTINWTVRGTALRQPVS